MICPRCGERPRAEFIVHRNQWGYLTYRHRCPRGSRGSVNTGRRYTKQAAKV